MLKVSLYYLSVIVTQSYLTALKRTERRLSLTYPYIILPILTQNRSTYLSLHNITYPYSKQLNLTYPYITLLIPTQNYPTLPKRIFRLVPAVSLFQRNEVRNIAAETSPLTVSNQ